MFIITTSTVHRWRADRPAARRRAAPRASANAPSGDARPGRDTPRRISGRIRFRPASTHSFSAGGVHSSVHLRRAAAVAEAAANAAGAAAGAHLYAGRRTLNIAVSTDGLTLVNQSVGGGGDGGGAAGGGGRGRRGGGEHRRAALASYSSNHNTLLSTIRWSARSPARSAVRPRPRPS